MTGSANVSYDRDVARFARCNKRGVTLMLDVDDDFLEQPMAISPLKKAQCCAQRIWLSVEKSSC